MNNNSNLSLTAFNQDGLELVINQQTGEVFASQRAIARMSGVSESAIRKWIGVHQIPVKNAEILTAGGLQGANLLDEDAIYAALEKYNPKMLTVCAKVGLRVYLHQLAGYQVTSSAVQPQSPQQQLPPQRDAIDYLNATEKLATLPDSRLKRLVEFRLLCEIEHINVNQERLSGEDAPKKEPITSCAYAAQLLGYKPSEIGSGAALGKYVKSRINPETQEWQGSFYVYHYKVSNELNDVIHAYFASKGISKPILTFIR